MSTFVLVHGAFRGGWSWDRVRPLLAETGHDVHAPTLDATASGLERWVDQVADLITGADLDEVVLVGHSQGGVVVREVAVRIPERLRRLVYVDAAVPDPGERAIDVAPTPPDPALLPPREMLIPPRPLEPGGDLDAATADWLNARLVPTPFAPSLDPASDLTAGGARDVRVLLRHPRDLPLRHDPRPSRPAGHAVRRARRRPRRPLDPTRGGRGAVAPGRTDSPSWGRHD